MSLESRITNDSPGLIFINGRKWSLEGSYRPTWIALFASWLLNRQNPRGGVNSLRSISVIPFSLVATLTSPGLGPLPLETSAVNPLGRLLYWTFPTLILREDL